MQSVLNNAVIKNNSGGGYDLEHKYCSIRACLYMEVRVC